MPRRLPVRPAKLIGNLFVLAALTLIFTIYYVYVGIVMGPRAMGKQLLSAGLLRAFFVFEINY
jgi:hypothetical protein